MLLANTSSLSMWITLLLGVAATLGYLLGRRQVRRPTAGQADGRGEILRALAVAKELESIAERLRAAMSSHLPAVAKFQRRLDRIEGSPSGSWQELCDRADELLKPTLRLGSEISHSYAEILRQMAHLASFAELRADPLTGINNRRAFDESLQAHMAEQSRYPSPLSLAMIDVDCFKQVNDTHGHLQGDRVLQELARNLKTCVRECDFLARYGGEEFVVLMPRTELHAACNLAERMRSSVAASLSITISIGLAEWLPSDTPSSFVARADTALYAAKDGGRNCVYLHEGETGRIVGIRSAPQEKVDNAAKIVAFPLPLVPTVLPVVGIEFQSGVG
jgi:diguanylate cyclase (GGDEF)-like protein